VIGLVLCGFAVGGAAAEPTVMTPAGSHLEWSTWVAEHAPAAVVLWSSWTPEAGGALDALGEIETIAAHKGLEFVLVSVQEDAGDAARALGRVEVEWLSDRFGTLLKHYRVVRIPALLVIDAEGVAVARLVPTAAALDGWTRE
jgi:hypothetical protein